MARAGLGQTMKFKLLVHRLGLPAPYVRGLLETLWESAHPTGNSVLGGSAEVEIAAEWPGVPGLLFAALSADGAWLDETQPGVWAIHDFKDHAPEYVKKRIERRREREERESALAGRRRKSPERRTTSDKPSETEQAETWRPVWDAFLAAYSEHATRRGAKAPDLKPTKSRQEMILTRLRDYPVEDLCDAARGIFLSSHHAGENDRNETYLTIELALAIGRSRNNVEKFRDLYRQRKAAPSVRTEHGYEFGGGDQKVLPDGVGHPTGRLWSTKRGEYVDAREWEPADPADESRYARNAMRLAAQARAAA